MRKIKDKNYKNKHQNDKRNSKKNIRNNTLFFIIALFAMLIIVTIVSNVVHGLNEINVTKSAPKTVAFNRSFDITIKIQNEINKELNITVNEPYSSLIVLSKLNHTNFNLSSLNNSQYKFYIPPQYYIWNFLLKAYSTRIIKYKVKAIISGITVINPTTVFTDGKSFTSNPLFIKVQCNNNGICEQQLGENEVTCPHDCKLNKKNKTIIKINNKSNLNNKHNNSKKYNQTANIKKNKINNKNNTTTGINSMNRYINQTILITIIFIIIIVLIFVLIYFEMNINAKKTKSKNEWLGRFNNNNIKEKNVGNNINKIDTKKLNSESYIITNKKQ